jgi:hypothetical protein
MEEEKKECSDTPSIHEEDQGYEWNTHHENLLKSWSEISKHYSVLHEHSGKFYSKIHTVLGLPSKIIFGVLSSIEFSQLSNDGDSNQWAKYVVGFMSLVGLCISLAQEFLAYESLSFKHFKMVSLYEKLYIDIQIELSYPVEKRINIKAFLRNIKNRLMDHKSISPSIPDHIVNKYIQNHEKDINLSHLKYTKLLIIPATSEPITSNPIIPEPIITTQQPPPQPSSTDSPILSDIQDEFTKEMLKKLEMHKETVKNYQLEQIQLFNNETQLNPV